MTPCATLPEPAAAPEEENLMPGLTFTPNPGGAAVETPAFVAQWLRDGDRLFLNYRTVVDPSLPPHCVGSAVCLDDLITALTLLSTARHGKALNDA